MQHGFFIGIGSNIQPNHNFPQIMTKLVKEFGKLQLSRVIYTTPVGMTSKHLFLNAVLYLECELRPEQLKETFNCIEISLGRDRCDPQRNVKDRLADLDILLSLPPSGSIEPNYLPKETYLHPCFIELTTIMGKQTHNKGTTDFAGVELQLDGQIFGHTPCLIYYQKETDKITVSVL